MLWTLNFQKTLEASEGLSFSLKHIQSNAWMARESMGGPQRGSPTAKGKLPMLLPPREWGFPQRVQESRVTRPSRR